MCFLSYLCMQNPSEYNEVGKQLFSYFWKEQLIALVKNDAVVLIRTSVRPNNLCITVLLCIPYFR